MNMINFPLLELAGNNIWQSLIILGVVLVVFKMISKSSAEERSWSLSATLFVLAILPFAAFLPGEGLKMIKEPAPANYSAYEYSVINTVDSDSSFIPRTPVPEKKTLKELPLEKVELPTIGKDELVIAALALWFVGSLIALIKLGGAALNASRIKSSAYPYVLDDSLSKNWPDDIEVAVSDDVTSPIVIGFVKPLIILPSRFVNSMTADQLKPLLYHELAHIKRFDNCFYLIERVILALYWWNPVMHYLAARLAEERELACDDRAALECGDQVEFAKSLLTGAKHLIGHNKSVLGLAALRRESVLSKRVKRMTEGMTLKGVDMTRLAKNVIAICFTIAIIGLITPRFNESFAQDSDYSDRIEALLKIESGDGFTVGLDELPDEAMPEFTAEFMAKDDLSREQLKRLAIRIHNIEDEDLQSDALNHILAADDDELDLETRKLVIASVLGRARVQEIRESIKEGIRNIPSNIEIEAIREDIRQAIKDLPTEEMILEIQTDIAEEIKNLPTERIIAEAHAEVEKALADLPKTLEGEIDMDAIIAEVETELRNIEIDIDVDEIRAEIEMSLEELPTQEEIEEMKKDLEESLSEVLTEEEAEEMRRELEKELERFPTGDETE
ncbi:M56 family metallopeptidase [Pseudemcibacter aquimaris]|uniref:M56 family metallopeptidase n=1 Tax=Pseudemcibacter aquimaris TaxID=2857064 RepID=UPI0020113796|nr:M56 family metallopeptidase [Pseudemcibacter aquimaris]MCC3860349.1 hypothetical protein [Pseudemcibacter aquimaris]WDU57675.1 hypothetical protein KW060_10760 [Pseudemcibacter aquimaris]